MSDRLLAGIRVVETASAAAEFAGRLLADLGAEVWKIEPPGGAPARRHPPFSAHDRQQSLFFEYYDAGKRSLVADPAREEDRRRLRELLAAADVWLDSTPPRQAPAHGVDFDDACAANPRLVLVRVTPFGLDGPHAAFRSSDLVAQAAGGMVFTNGFPGEAPLQGFGLQAYHAASAYAVIGTLLALLERRRSGRGQTVDVSVQEAVVGALEHVTAAWHAERRVELRRGPLHWSRVFRTCRCRDGWVVLSLFGDWPTIVGWMMERGFGERFAAAPWDDLFFRRDHAEELFAELERWAADLGGEEIFAGAQLRRLPFAAVRPPEALRDDPQLAARGFFGTIPGTSLRFPGPAFRMSTTPLHTRSAAPALGEATWPEAPPTAAGPVAPRRRAGRVLAGIRVLDFTHVVAGPLATRILADHGAEVIKVERRVTLDLGERRGGLFGNLNRGKRSVILNLASPRGIDLARRLAAQSDVVIDNFSARVMAQWGLDYEGLRRLRPDVIGVGMSGFGQTGPQREYVSFGPTLQAICGHTSAIRRRGAEPAGWGFSHSDVCAGLNGALAVIAALHHRARTGEGQFIDLSQLESVAAYMGPRLLDLAHEPAAPTENCSQEAPGAPHGVYRCAGEDRWVAIAVLDDDDWRRFAEVVGEPWAADARFASRESRIAHADELDACVGGWTVRCAAHEIAATCQQHGIAAFTVANGEDLCAGDPHLQARGFWARVPSPEGTTVTLDGVPVKLSATPGSVEAPGPLHGEHTAQVLRERLGLGDEEIEALRTDRTIA